MRILVLGGDGYIGWPATMRFAMCGHEVYVIDDMSKRKRLMEYGTETLVRCPPLHDRVREFTDSSGKQINIKVGSLLNHRFLYSTIDAFQPEVILHLANQGSVPLSMKDRAEAVGGLENDILGMTNLLFAARHSRSNPHVILLDDAHTASPNEASIDTSPCSFAHLARIQQTQQAAFLARTWGMRLSLLKSGIVYGCDTTETTLAEHLTPSIYYDELFGCVVHRFCAQAAAARPLTVHGDGSQVHRFIHLNDVLSAIERTFMAGHAGLGLQINNAYTDEMALTELASVVAEGARLHGVETEIAYVPDPRQEPVSLSPAAGQNMAPETERLLNRDKIESVLKPFIDRAGELRENQLGSATITWRSEKAVSTRSAGGRKGPIKKLCFSTGKRGGFGALNPFLRMVAEDPELELQLVCTDMHLHESFGKTANEVARYFNISRVVDMAQISDSNVDRTRSLGRCMTGMAQVLGELDPDIVLLLGDRSETLATAFAAVEMGIPIAHVQAGDVSGGLDDIHRHAITKLAHLHFSQTERQKQRVLALGEEPWRVHTVGAPYADRIIAGKYNSDPEYLSKKYGVDVTVPFHIVLHHPDTYRPQESYSQMHGILQVLNERSEQVILVYPCSDQGFQGVINAIEEMRANPRYHIHFSIDSFDFLGLLSHTELFLGNSSAGIIEAPYFKLPFINVGERQSFREKGNNVIDAGTTPETIREAVAKGLSPEFRELLANTEPLFGDGSANERIYKILKQTEVGPEFFHKKVNG